MPREVELKSVVEDVDACRRRIEAAGAQMTFEGRLEDRRYDTDERGLSDGDQLLRVRSFSGEQGVRAALEWKGPTRQERGYKVRDELTADTTHAAPLAAILEQLGYRVIGAIDRHVAQYSLDDATIRFEHYPCMDSLVEVEGPPTAIERAIEALGIPREGFSPDRLAAFMARFEQRTGRRAAVNDGQLGDTVADGVADG